MNKICVRFSKHPFFYLRLMYQLQKFTPTLNAASYVTSVDAIDAFTIDFLQRHKRSRTVFERNNLSIRHFMETENVPKDIRDMSVDELDETVLQLMSKNKDKKLLGFISECVEAHKKISDITLKKLFRHYSIAGKPDVIEALQKYSCKVNPSTHKRNGEFQHYLAKSQCMKGNSEKGLAILKDCYLKNDGLRSYYRIIFRELIQDSVMNRSEASLVIFKKYVLEFSVTFGDHYPLVCFWHLCWSSSWFSDHMLSNELLEASESLLNILKDKATAFSISILRQEYNEDAVIRLLQMLLKYHLMDEYAKVLQVLFSYKVKNRDVRGCMEIVKNCEVLGVNLPTDQLGKYIKMIIEGKSPETKPPSKPTFKNFKLKF